MLEFTKTHTNEPYDQSTCRAGNPLSTAWTRQWLPKYNNHFRLIHQGAWLNIWQAGSPKSQTYRLRPKKKNPSVLSWCRFPTQAQRNPLKQKVVVREYTQEDTLSLKTNINMGI